MEFRRMEFGSRRFRDAARKLLAAAPAPSPVPSPYSCRDLTSGAAVNCQNPHTLIIIVAGMACMMFLVIIAMLLLCWSVVRQRRLERERRQDNGGESSNHTASTPSATPPIVDSPEFDDVVLVQLPGDENPHFFALPKPFPSDALPQPDWKKSTCEDVAIKVEEKDPSSEDRVSQIANFEHDPANPAVEDACVPTSDGHLHNPLFAPR